jgi:hypothetical protein
MAGVRRVKWLPGETPFGKGKGIVGLGSRNWEPTPLPEEKTGSQTAKVVEPEKPKDEALEVQKRWEAKQNAITDKSKREQSQE